MTESFIARRAVVVLLTRCNGDVIRVVINVFMSLQQLFLSEGLIAIVTLERLLIGVNEHVRLEMTSRDRSVGANFTSVTLLSLVSLCVDFVAVAIRKIAITTFALDGNVARVKLLNVNSQVCLTTACRWAKRALENWFVAD